MTDKQIKALWSSTGKRSQVVL